MSFNHVNKYTKDRIQLNCRFIKCQKLKATKMARASENFLFAQDLQIKVRYIYIKLPLSLSGLCQLWRHHLHQGSSAIPSMQLVSGIAKLSIFRLFYYGSCLLQASFQRLSITQASGLLCAKACFSISQPIHPSIHPSKNENNLFRLVVLEEAFSQYNHNLFLTRRL